MMTAAVLCSAFRGADNAAGGGVSHDQDHNNELFLKEVGGLLGKDMFTLGSSVCSRDDGDSIPDDRASLKQAAKRDSDHEVVVLPDPAESATRIQANCRRYLQQRYARIQQLQQRLQRMDLERQGGLEQVQRRKERKLRRIQKKYDRKEAEQEAEYQKVAGIVQYLQRDQSRFGKELENHRTFCRDLKASNQRLGLEQERTLEAIQHKKQDVNQLEAINARLQAILSIQMEAIRLCRICLEQEPEPEQQLTVVSVGPPGDPPIPRENHTSQPYETSINVNCVNEAEENCFNYRLVQDVYTLTPRQI